MFEALLPTLVSSAFSLFGGLSQNKENEDQADANRQFQESMSNTAHQREVRDLIAAGLNPILSATRGGASTPSPSTYHAEDAIGKAVNSGLDAWKKEADIASTRRNTNIKEPIEKIAGAASAGVDAVQAGVKGAVEAVLENIPTMKGNISQAVEAVKEAASSAGVKIEDVIRAPSRFIGEKVNSAQDFVAKQKELSAVNAAQFVGRNRVKAGSFTGDRKKDLKDLASIKDLTERRRAIQSYRYWLGQRR